MLQEKHSPLAKSVMMTMAAVSPQTLSPSIVSSTLVIAECLGILSLEEISKALTPSGYINLVDKGITKRMDNESTDILDVDLNTNLKIAEDVLSVINDDINPLQKRENQNSLHLMGINISLRPGLSGDRVFADARSLYQAMRLKHTQEPNDFLFWR